MERQRNRITRMNSFAVIVLAVVGASAMHEAIAGLGPLVRTDAYIVSVLALLGVGWYANRDHRSAHSPVPLGLLILAVVIKIGWLMTHLSTNATLTHDLGVSAMLVLAILLTVNPR